jgi:hypothetical protein
MVTGETPDISEWIDFEFYDRVWFYNQKKIKIDGSGRRLARWLCIAHQRPMLLAAPQIWVDYRSHNGAACCA